MLNLFPTHSVLIERALNSIEFRFDCTVQSANHLSIGITKSIVLDVVEQVETLLAAFDHIRSKAETCGLCKSLDDFNRQVDDVTVCAHKHSLQSWSMACGNMQSHVSVGPEASASGPTPFACSFVSALPLFSTARQSKPSERGLLRPRGCAPRPRPRRRRACRRLPRPAAPWPGGPPSAGSSSCAGSARQRGS